MALIQTGSIITDIKGKLAGHVFQNSQGGLMVRTGRRPSLKRGFSQNAVRQAIVAVQSAWSGLSASDRALWNALSILQARPQKKNVGRKISDQSLFIQENSLRATMLQYNVNIAPTFITTPIIQAPLPQAPISTIVNAGGTLTVNMVNGINTAAYYMCLKMSRPLSGAQRSAWNKKVIIPFPIANASSFNITTAYTKLFSILPQVGQFVNVSVIIGACIAGGTSLEWNQRIQIT